MVHCTQIGAEWHNMREQRVMHINGCSFVLKEDERPLKIQKYTITDVQFLGL